MSGMMQMHVTEQLITMAAKLVLAVAAQELTLKMNVEMAQIQMGVYHVLP
jgi:hypothetical protein